MACGPGLYRKQTSNTQWHPTDSGVRSPRGQNGLDLSEYTLTLSVPLSHVGDDLLRAAVLKGVRWSLWASRTTWLKSLPSSRDIYPSGRDLRPFLVQGERIQPLVSASNSAMNDIKCIESGGCQGFATSLKVPAMTRLRPEP